MKCLHLSASLSRNAGGIFEIELAVARHLKSLGVRVEAFGLEDTDWGMDRDRWDGIPARVFATRGPRAFGYAPGMLKELIGANADLVHLHYMWMYPSVMVSRWSSVTQNPYVVTPNGMLEPWALSNAAWKKKIAGKLYENRMLRGAACVQANTKKEAKDFRSYGLRNPVCVIPNGVELVEDEILVGESSAGDARTLLFLGRMHPKKGLVNALRAWGKIRKMENRVPKADEWKFVIAGWDEGGHRAELEHLCRDLDLVSADIPAVDFLRAPPGERSASVPHASVVFVGPAFGEHKTSLLRQADAFILPSFSEGLPMAVLEAWAHRLPVLMTAQCNLPEGFAADAAIRIGTDVDSLVHGMADLMRAQVADLQTMGDHGRSLVERQFTWPQVAVQMKEVYDWVLGGGVKPGCVEF